MSDQLMLLPTSDLTTYSNDFCTVSASSEFDTNYAWKAFSTVLDTYYWHSNGSHKLKIEFKNSQECIKRFIFSTRKDSGIGQLPTGVQVYGSNDDITYTLVDSKTFTGLAINSTYTYDITNENFYKYYRFDWGSSTGYVVVRVFKLYALEHKMFVFKKDNYYISIKDTLYDTVTKTYSLIDANTVTTEDLKNIGFRNLGSLYQNITINGETFVPIDKIRSSLGERYSLIKINLIN